MKRIRLHPNKPNPADPVFTQLLLDVQLGKPATFVGDRCFAEHTADHLAFYRRGRCANSDRVGDWLTTSPDNFDAPEIHCKLLIARANKRGDYLAKFWCDEDLIQNYFLSLFNDRLYVSLTDREP
jgi:hypothetical protein